MKIFVSLLLTTALFAANNQYERGDNKIIDIGRRSLLQKVEVPKDWQYFLDRKRGAGIHNRTSATLVDSQGYKSIAITKSKDGYLLEVDDRDELVLTGRLVDDDSSQLETMLGLLMDSKDENKIAVKLFTAQGVLRHDDKVDVETCSGAQKLAIKAALGSEATYIIGPPGTGKTSVIRRIIAECAMRGERVLIASQTRAAIDNVFDSEHRGRNPILDTVAFDDLVIDFPSSKHEDMSAKEKVRTKQVALEQERTDVLDALRESNDLISQFRVVWKETKQKSNKLKSEIAEIANNLAVAERQLCRAKEDCDNAQKRYADADKNVARRMLAAAVGKKDLALGSLSETVAKAQENLSVAEKAVAQIKAAKQEKQQEIEANDLERIEIEASKVKQAIEYCDKRLADIAQELRDLNHESIISAGKVVVATLAACSVAKRFAKQRFDAVVIDEASMATLPALWLTASLADARVVIVGDPAQLSPIAITKELRQSIYDYTDVGKAFYEGTAHPLSVMLDTQHRCRHAIGDLVSKVFYGGKLKSAINAGIVEGTSRSLLLGQRSASHYVQEFLGTGKSIGVISPFRSRVEEINRSLESVLTTSDDKSDVWVETIHRFQGSERDVLILDLTGVITNNGEISKMVAGEAGSEAARLLNVASTRARHCPIAIVDTALIFSAIRERYGTAADRQILYIWLQAFCEMQKKEEAQHEHSSLAEIN